MFHPHFKDKTESQRGSGVCPRLSSSTWESQDQDPDCLTLEPMREPGCLVVSSDHDGGKVSTVQGGTCEAALRIPQCLVPRGGA